MLISKITDKDVTYRVVEKETGKPLEPTRTSLFEKNADGKVYFDGRFIATPLFEYVKETLE